MPETIVLAKKVKAYRKKLEETQLEFADEVGISPDMLSLIEREKANPSLQTIQKVAARMGVTVSELLEVEGEV